MHTTGNFWTDLPSRIDAVIFSIGTYEARWYGLMYVVAFAIVLFLINHRIRTERLPPNDLPLSFATWAIIGVLFGGRLGYVLFYDPGMLRQNPLNIILPIDFSSGIKYTGIAGMSYHGGLLGVTLAFILFCRRRRVRMLPLADLFASAVPLGYTFGRLGNFINGELYGRVTSVPWAMRFPMDPTGQLRHPSQLYEAFGEGLLLFVVLWVTRRKAPFAGFTTGLYLLGYGCIRFLIEFVRQPDDHLGTVVGVFSMGQVLCAAMIVAGVALLVVQARRQRGKNDRLLPLRHLSIPPSADA
jgi:phosphatidylglycerol:prolipoprotein diacylglycerol transferase